MNFGLIIAFLTFLSSLEAGSNSDRPCRPGTFRLSDIARVLAYAVEALYRISTFCFGAVCGALALALALVIPESVRFREQIITGAFAVVASSILVQGLTIIPLLRKAEAQAGN